MRSSKICTIQQEVPSKRVTIHDYLEGLDFADTRKLGLWRLIQDSICKWERRMAVFIRVFVANKIYRDKTVERNHETEEDQVTSRTGQRLSIL